MAFALVLAHPLILFLYDPGYLEYLDPRVSFVRALALVALTGALVLLIVLTLWRQELGIPYEWWRLSHAVLGVFAVGIGLVHVLRVGYYVSVPWQQALWSAVTGAALLLLLHVRVVKPLLMRQHPYRVVDIRPERGKSWSVALAPEGHGGMQFRPGQFAWLTLGPSPFSLEQHPFSFSSSAVDPRRLEFTIKELGDFTSQIGGVPKESRAYLEGPYGAFVLDLERSTGAVFIAGGIGISPIMSMLRSLRDRDDPRPLVLIYGNPSWEAVTFREELDEMGGRLRLHLVHVLEDPPPGWRGESGFVTAEILDRHLPAKAPEEYDYFACGPPPMMDLVERYLRLRGVPLANIHAERFVIV